MVRWCNHLWLGGRRLLGPGALEAEEGSLRFGGDRELIVSSGREGEGTRSMLLEGEASACARGCGNLNRHASEAA